MQPMTWKHDMVTGCFTKHKVSLSPCTIESGWSHQNFKIVPFFGTGNRTHGKRKWSEILSVSWHTLKAGLMLSSLFLHSILPPFPSSLFSHPFRPSSILMSGCRAKTFWRPDTTLICLFCRTQFWPFSSGCLNSCQFCSVDSVDFPRISPSCVDIFQSHLPILCNSLPTIPPFPSILLSLSLPPTQVSQRLLWYQQSCFHLQVPWCLDSQWLLLLWLLLLLWFSCHQWFCSRCSEVDLCSAAFCKLLSKVILTLLVLLMRNKWWCNLHLSAKFVAIYALYLELKLLQKIWWVSMWWMGSVTLPFANCRGPLGLAKWK